MPELHEWEGNAEAQQIIRQVSEVTNRAWRGIGVIPAAAWRLLRAGAFQA